MARYHINTKGEAGVCRAQHGGCPFGSDAEHFDSMPEAQAAAEKRMAEQEGTLPSAAKKARSEVVIPAAEYEWRGEQVKGSDLKPGDKMTSGAEILSNHIGRKYNAVTVADEKKGARTIHIPLEEDTAAFVRYETEESKAVRSAATKEKHTSEVANRYKPQRAVAAKAIQDQVEKGYPLHGYHLDNLVEAEAKDAVMARYKAVVKQVQEHEPSEAHPYTRALDLYKQELQDEVLSASSRGNSVSTSEAHNLYERGMNSAKAEFIRHGIRLF